MIQKIKQSQQDLRISLSWSWEKESLGFTSEFLAWAPKRGLELVDLRRKMFTSGHFGFEVPEGKLPGKCWLRAQRNCLMGGAGLGVKYVEK